MSNNAAGTTAPRARIIKFKLPSIKERNRKRSVYSSETLVRSVRFMRYCLVCSASLFRAMAPWGLATAEVAAMLLLYFIAVPNALLVRQRLSRYSYGFDHSLEDVVFLSLARGAAVTAAYFTGAGAKHHRPYMWTAYAFAAIGGPFVLAKLLAFEYPQHSAAVVLVLLTSLAFTCLHLTAAHNMVRWARHRSDMGLDGFGYPWEEGEEAWVMLGRTGSLGAFGPGQDDSEDVSPRALADPDSQFVECGAMTVHVKEAAPLAGEGQSEVGIVLIHGYGSGVFAWRHIMWPLARATGCRVLAFDRPAFGLTSRPRPPTRGDSPYSLRSAARLALALAGQQGLKRVVFVGHADGALVALLATAMAAGLPAGWTGGDAAADSEDDGERSSGSSAFGSSGAAAEHGSNRSGTPESLASSSNGALRRSGGSGLWRKVLGGAGLAPLAEQSEVDIEAGVPLMAPSSAGSGSLDAGSGSSRPPSQQAPRQQRQQQQQQPPQDQHRDAPEPTKTPMAAGPPSTLAPAVSGANLKLRGAVPGGAVLAVSAAAGHAAVRHLRSDSQTSSLAPSSGGKSSGSGVPSTPLTVLVVPEPGSDSATVSEDLADDCGLYSPMLSPRQQGAGGSGGSSSAEDLTIELTSPTGRSSDFFAPPAEMRAPALSPGDDDWRGLLTDASGGGGHYFDTGGPRPEPLGLALLHPSTAGVLGPSFTRLLARSKLGRRMLRPLLRSEVGEVSNRRAWHEPAKLTAEVLEHYKRPLRARNWDAALVEVSRLPREVTERQLAGLCGAAARLPAAVATGAHDRVSPTTCAAQLAADLGAPPPAILPECGHLSHEEAPQALLEFLTTFVRGCLADKGGSSPGELQYSGG